MCWQEQQFHYDSTTFRLLSESKNNWAQLVLWWVPDWNPKCYPFLLPRYHIEWLYNGTLLHLNGLGFREYSKSHCTIALTHY